MLVRHDHAPLAMRDLVLNASHIISPIHKNLQRLVAQKLPHRDRAVTKVLGDFLIDKLIVKLNVGGVVLGVGVVNFLQARPIDCGKTHGTWLATCVDNGADKFEIFLVGTRHANSLHLGMRGGIVGGGDLIPALADHQAILHNHCAKWTAIAPHILAGKVNGLAHKCLMRIILHEIPGLVNARSCAGVVLRRLGLMHCKEKPALYLYRHLERL